MRTQRAAAPRLSAPAFLPRSLSKKKQKKKITRRLKTITRRLGALCRASRAWRKYSGGENTAPPSQKEEPTACARQCAAASWTCYRKKAGGGAEPGPRAQSLPTRISRTYTRSPRRRAESPGAPLLGLHPAVGAWDTKAHPGGDKEDHRFPMHTCARHACNPRTLRCNRA